MQEDIYQEQLREHVLHYIGINISDVSFGLESIVVRFGRTIYYWSHFFRESVGVGFKDYLWQLRLGRAKELLSQTNETQQHIIEVVGYQDVTSFIRRFKASEGITPGQYRKAYQEKRVPQEE